MEIKDLKIEELEEKKEEEKKQNIEFFYDIPLKISVYLGKAKLKIRDILKLDIDSIVELDKTAGEAADIYVNDRMFAKGEIIVSENTFAVRITHIINPEDVTKIELIQK